MTKQNSSNPFYKIDKIRESVTRFMGRDTSRMTPQEQEQWAKECLNLPYSWALYFCRDYFRGLLNDK